MIMIFGRQTEVVLDVARAGGATSACSTRDRRREDYTICWRMPAGSCVCRERTSPASRGAEDADLVDRAALHRLGAQPPAEREARAGPPGGVAPFGMDVRVRLSRVSCVSARHPLIRIAVPAGATLAVVGDRDVHPSFTGIGCFVQQADAVARARVLTPTAVGSSRAAW